MKIAFVLRTAFLEKERFADYTFHLNEKFHRLDYFGTALNHSQEYRDQCWNLFRKIIQRLNSKYSFDFDCMTMSISDHRFSWLCSGETLFRLRLMQDNNRIVKMNFPEEIL